VDVTTGQERTQISDPAVMRALAHPARLELLEYLGLTEDGATATECAEVVGLSPSATSYHLRALAKVGMIQDGPGRGDGRERVWRSSHRSYAVGGDHDATPEDIEAERVMVETVLARQNDRVRRYLARARRDSPDWFDLLWVGEHTLQVTTRELATLTAKIQELLEPLKRVNRPDPPKDSRLTSVQLRITPMD
jgi:DNA-binding transcriptional ArsR family regulator